MASFAGVNIVDVNEEAADYGRWLILGAQGAGKRLPLGTRVLTPHGWTPIEDLEIGSKVIGVDGKPYPVYGKSAEVERETYKVTLNDGASVLADADHLWEVEAKRTGRKVVNTEELRRKLLSGSFGYVIPRMEAAHHPEADLPVDPYLLGALLADGYLHGGAVTWTKGEHSVVEGMLPIIRDLDYVQEFPKNNTPRIRFRGDRLKSALEALNLRVPSAEKFIPSVYLTASIQQRRDLLAGLFDGDGRLSGKGQRLYHSTSERLVRDVQRLCWSLGIGANIHKHKSDGTWALGLTTPHNPFRFCRWAAHVKTTKYNEKRRVVAVEPAGLTTGLCIAVDSPRNLYVTEDYIVTHNSSLASTVATMGKTLFIDLPGEKGTQSFKNAPYAKNIDVVRPESVTALDDIFWSLDKGGHGYKAVILDSLTALQKMTMRYLTGFSETAVREIKQGTAPADQRTWGQALDIMTDTAVFWYGLADGNRKEPMHVVMTAQVKMVEDEINGGVRRSPDVQRGAQSIIRATPNYIIYADVEEDLDNAGRDDGPSLKHIVRFGTDPEYGTKARIPYNLRGKVPSVLGRDHPVTLEKLSRFLGVGGVPERKPAADKPAKADN